jgi:uncharacterized membrane protein
MQGIFASAQAAFTLLLILIVGWVIVFLAGSLAERKFGKKQGGESFWSAFTWVWDHANLIGIPMLVFGAAYLIWAMNYGPGLGGPSLLVLMLMGAAGMLIGFAPSLRRR